MVMKMSSQAGKDAIARRIKPIYGGQVVGKPKPLAGGAIAKPGGGGSGVIKTPTSPMDKLADTVKSAKPTPVTPGNNPVQAIKDAKVAQLKKMTTTKDQILNAGKYNSSQDGLFKSKVVK